MISGFPILWGTDAIVKQRLLDELNSVAQQFKLELLDLPIVTSKKILQKALGVDSEIATKQFYEIGDSKDLILRPELTAQTVHEFLDSSFGKRGQRKNLYSWGSCFRKENPQKGRLHQFTQWNFEQLITTPQSIYQTFSLLNAFISKLDLTKTVELQINYLDSRQLQLAQTELKKTINSIDLCSLCERRLQNKKLFKILDCKTCHSKINKKTSLYSFLSNAKKNEFKKILEKLKLIMPKVKIKLMPNLVRGLDYYTGIIFELFSTNENHSQNAILAGGEYQISAFAAQDSNLKNALGIGFAVGLERLISVLNAEKLTTLSEQKIKKVAIAYSNSELFNDPEIFQLENKLIDSGFQTTLQSTSMSFTKASKKAIKQSEHFLVFFGEDWIELKKISINVIDRTGKLIEINQLSKVNDVVKFLNDERDDFNW